MAEAFDCVLHKGEVGGVYNVGTDKERTVAEVAQVGEGVGGREGGS